MQERVSSLLELIDSAPTTEFWYGSSLLARCVQAGDPILVEALAIRHQALGNKAAGSAHVIRQTIQAIDSLNGQDLKGLWQMVDAHPPEEILTAERPCGDSHWAAANLIGEIGGSAAFYSISDRLSKATGSQVELLVRILAHLALRFIEIVSAEAPRLTHERV